MNITWEKLVLWIIGILVAAVIIFFLVNALSMKDGSLISTFFKGAGSAANSTTP